MQMERFTSWLGGRGPLVIITLVLAGLLGSGYGQTWFGAHAASLTGNGAACASPVPAAWARAWSRPPA